MARRPENRSNRGRRPESSLDWLKEPEPQAGQEPRGGLTSAPPPEGPQYPAQHPQAHQPQTHQQPYRPLPQNPAPAPYPAQQPYRPLSPGPAPAPDSGATTMLSRRAARAQREAAQQAAAPAPTTPAGPHAPRPGDPWAPQTPVPQTPAPQIQDPRIQARQAPGRQAPAPWAEPLDQGRRELAGHPSAPMRTRDRTPSPPDDPPEPGRGSSSGPDRPPNPKLDQKPGRRRHVAAWLILAALLLALWAATAFVDSGNFVISGLASLSPLVTVLALPVIAIGVGSRHVVPTAIAVVAALVPWGFVAGYAAAGPGRSVVGSNSTLRVMSVDGAQGRADARNIVQVARVYSVDVVVVTQLSNELAHQLTVAGLNVLGPARWVKVPTDGMDGTGVWSGPQIENLQPINDLSRPGVQGDIDAGNDKVGITVVQLTGEPLRRSLSWHSDLKKLAARKPAATPGFVVGDLNATPWQPAFRKLTAAGWRDAADVVGQGLRPTWPSWSPLPIAPLDHVLVSSGLGVNSASTTDIVGSDHRALIVTLVVPHAGG